MGLWMLWLYVGLAGRTREEAVNVGAKGVHSLGLLVKGFWFCTLFVVMESRLACSHCMGRSQFPWHGLEQGADRVVVMSK